MGSWCGDSSRLELWNNNDCQKLTAGLDGYVTSIIKHHSVRTFDLASTNTALRADYTCANSCNNSCNTSCNTSCNNSCNNSCDVSANSCAASANSCNVNSCGLSSCSSSTVCSTSSTDCNSGCNNCNAANRLTRYSLLKQFNNLGGGVYTYASNLITAADFTTRSVDVRTSVKGDATVRLVYSHGGFDLGFGYNVFGQVREQITAVGAPSSCCISTATGTVFAVKGCQGVVYNSYAVTGLAVPGTVPTLGALTQVPLINSASTGSAYVNGCGNGASCVTPDNPAYVASTATVLNVVVTAPVVAGTVLGGTLAEPTLAGAVIAPAQSTPPVVLVGAANELDLSSGNSSTSIH